MNKREICSATVLNKLSELLDIISLDDNEQLRIRANILRAHCLVHEVKICEQMKVRKFISRESSIKLQEFRDQIELFATFILNNFGQNKKAFANKLYLSILLLDYIISGKTETYDLGAVVFNIIRAVENAHSRKEAF